MNVLFLNPPTASGSIYMKEIGRCGSTASGNQYWPQTGLAYLAAVAEQSGCRAKIIDAIAEERASQQVIRAAQEFSPDLVLIHTTTPTFNNDIKFLGMMKPAVNAVYGLVGNHAANMPKESLELSEADFVLVNEPELTLQEFLQGKDWGQVKGLAFRKDGVIRLNALRPLGKDLDTLPMPARHLLPNDRYKMVLTKNEVFATVVSSRGCPFSCIYCRVGNPWGKQFRKRSPGNVFSELSEIRNKYGIRNIVFMADTFTLDKRWVMELCGMITGSGLDINWLCNSRIDTIDDEMAGAMKRAGCSLISFGVESGSQQIIDNAKKGIDISKAKHAIDISRRAKIRSFAYFIIGLPGETKETIRQTIDFSKHIGSDFVNFHIATPHPGTELEELAREKGWIVDYDFDHYDQSGNYAVMRNESLTADEILKGQKKAIREFYFRPKIIAKQLAKIRSPRDFVDYSRIGLKMLLSK